MFSVFRINESDKTISTYSSEEEEEECLGLKGKTLPFYRIWAITCINHSGISHGIKWQVVFHINTCQEMVINRAWSCDSQQNVR